MTCVSDGWAAKLYSLSAVHILYTSTRR